MCGIAGFIGSGDETILWKMIRSISYRGPDHQGVFFKENTGLAHARLSIIDTDNRSNQPFSDLSGRYTIVFNGEIYNYLSLKKELQSSSISFTTSSDTEVLLNAYITWGPDCLTKLNGMFAFAIYDQQKKELFAARDRMGKKPFYYSFQNNTFVFASELKAILQHPSTKREINFNTLNGYLTYDYVSGNESIIKNIHKLAPGHYLKVNEEKILENKSYWEMRFKKESISFDDSVDKLGDLLNDAVQKRLMSDVPLGVFLSGGLDSSAIAYYSQKNSEKKIQTFSIGFQEKSYDETEYALLVSKHLGTTHHQQILTAQHTLELLPEIIQKMDEPFADPSIIPTFFLSKYTKQFVTVALGGDGSDELMAGYPTFISERVSNLFHSFPTFILNTLKHSAKLLLVNDKNISLDFKITQFLKGFESRKEYTHPLWLGSFGLKQKKSLLTQNVRAQIAFPDTLTEVDNCFKKVKGENYFDQLLYLYYRTYLLNDILVKIDRASMYSSLEVRSPFLDTEIVEFLNSLPKSYKIKGSNGKLILKTLMRDKLPSIIIDRPKKGFGIPVSLWLRNELRNTVENLFSKKRIQDQGIFEYSYIQNIIKEHQDKKYNHRKLIWNLFIFQVWYDNYFTND